MIKHNFPFIPPHCGVHIAQSRGTFPDHPAQALFDLLNRRDFALSRSIRTGQKELSHNMGWHLHDSDIPLGFVRKEGAQGAGFCSIRKGVHAFFGQRGFGYSYSFLVLPPMQRILVCMERCSLRARGIYRRESASFLERPNTKLPTNRRKTRLVGSSIIS